MDVVPPPLGSSHASHNGHESPEFAEIAKNVGYLEEKHHGKKGEKLAQNVLCLKKIDTSCIESIEF